MLARQPHSQCLAVTFDVGGTLVDPWPSVGHVYAQVAARFGFPGLDPARLNRQFLQAWHARGHFDYSKDSWRRIVVASFAGLLHPDQVHTLFESLFNQFGFPEAWRLYEDVLPAFRALHAQGFKLGVISNWDDRLIPLLARLQLLDFLDVAIVSCHAGFTKPAPQIFHQAAAALRLPPNRILHVGDSPQEDMAGAQAAGFLPILIRRSPADPRPVPAESIASLAELTR